MEMLNFGKNYQPGHKTPILLNFRLYFHPKKTTLESEHCDGWFCSFLFWNISVCQLLFNKLFVLICDMFFMKMHKSDRRKWIKMWRIKKGYCFAFLFIKGWWAEYSDWRQNGWILTRLWIEDACFFCLCMTLSFLWPIFWSRWSTSATQLNDIWAHLLTWCVCGLFSCIQRCLLSGWREWIGWIWSRHWNRYIWASALSRCWLWCYRCTTIHIIEVLLQHFNNT